MGWIDTELALTALAAMLSPTTLTFCVLVLVLSTRPLRTGAWFYAGALAATLAIGVVAAFVIGDVAADSTPSTPKTWVAVLDLVAAGALIVLAWRLLTRPADTAKTERAIDQMSKVASSSAVAILGAGATLANPGAFIPLALKQISELGPSAAEYAVDWLFFSLVSLLPLALALVCLLVAEDWARRVLERARAWLERRAWTIGAVLVLLIAAALIRNGVSGLGA